MTLNGSSLALLRSWPRADAQVGPRVQRARPLVTRTSTGSGAADHSGLTSETKASNHGYAVTILSDFPSLDDKNLLLDALDASKYLTTMQMMRVVRVIYHKALEASGNAYPMTWLSVQIMEKEGSELFLESLVICCREWLNQQESELKKRNRTQDAWPAFLSLLRELYATMQPKKLNACPESRHNRTVQPLVQAHKHSLCLANLILDCAILLLDPSRTKDPGYALHAESIVNTLRCVGAYLEQDNAFKLQQLTTLFREVLLSQGLKLSSMCKKNLLEAVECQASDWIFSPNQQVSDDGVTAQQTSLNQPFSCPQVYYFPYTKT